MAITPELSVRDWRASRRFYVEVLGFDVLYDRPEYGFSMLALGGGRLMIDQIGSGRTFDEVVVARGPLGLGLNLEIEVPDVAAIAARVEAARVVIPLEDRWYRTGASEAGQRQMVLRDPDGFLLRPFQTRGTRRARG